MYFYLWDCPARVIDLSEQVFGSEDEFIDFLFKNDVRDTRTATNAKWKDIERILEKEVEQLNDEE